MGKQRGIALLAMLAVMVMSVSWILVTVLNRSSADLAVAKRSRNAQVLNRAKQALIGYVAAQAAKAGENNPGALPCPENLGDFDSTTGRQGLTGTNCGSTSAQKVGRFPWKTLGLDQLVDADGEPLWYVVSRNWGVDIGVNTIINSAATGQLTVDGVANAAVALIIAPGAPLIVPASIGCTAWQQTRSPTGTPDWRNYLECENATTPADGTFVSRSTGTFNDHVLAVTAADMLGGIEAAIANRIEREINPILSGIYTASSWGLTGRERMFPYAATFTDPSASGFHGVSGRSQGLLPFNFGEACSPGTEPRCLPMSYTPSTPPVAYGAGGFGYIQAQTCVWDPADSTAALCSGEYHRNDSVPGGIGMRIEMTATVTNVATGFRFLDTRIEARNDTAPVGPWQAIAHTPVVTMNSDGSATIRFGANLPNIDAMGWGTWALYRIRLKVADHRILATRPRQLDFYNGTEEIRVGHTVTGANSGATGRVSKVTTTSGSWHTSSVSAGTLTFYSVTGTFTDNEDLRVGGATYARADGSASAADDDLSWFARNEWFRHVFYAVASGYLWTGGGTCSDTPSVTCLQVTGLSNSTYETKQRALLVLMGRHLSGQARPSSALDDFLDAAENTDGNTTFQQLKAGRSSNDRFITISRNP